MPRLEGASIAFVAIVLRALCIFYFSLASFNVPQMIFTWAVVPAFVVSFGAVKYASDKIDVCFKEVTSVTRDTIEIVPTYSETPHEGNPISRP